jgi:hypothetical protein
VTADEIAKSYPCAGSATAPLSHLASFPPLLARHRGFPPTQFAVGRTEERLSENLFISLTQCFKFGITHHTD